MMNNEELERKIEFIVNQQAQFSVDEAKLRQNLDVLRVDLDQLHEDVGQLREAQDTMVQTVSHMGEVVTRLARATHEGFKQTNEKVNALVDSHIRLADSQRRSDERINTLTDSQKRTDKILRKMQRGRRIYRIN